MYNQLSDKVYRKLHTIFLLIFFTISSIVLFILFFIFSLFFRKTLATEDWITIFIIASAILYLLHFKYEFKRFSAGIISQKITSYRNKEKRASEELRDELLRDFAGSVGKFTKIIDSRAVAENYHDERNKRISQLWIQSARCNRKKLFLESFYFQHCVEKPTRQQVQ